MSRKNKRQSKWTIDGWQKDPITEKDKTKILFDKIQIRQDIWARNLPKVFEILYLYVALLTEPCIPEKKIKALSGLNNWVVIMFFFILIKWLRRDVFFPLLMKYEIFILFLHRAWTMSPEQSQYIWRKTIPHIEVGMGSGVFTSHRSARFVLISDWWTRRKMELLDLVVTRPRLPVQRTKSPPAASGWEGS